MPNLPITTVSFLYIVNSIGIASDLLDITVTDLVIRRREFCFHVLPYYVTVLFVIVVRTCCYIVNNPRYII